MFICTADIVVGLFYIILWASKKAFGLVKLNLLTLMAGWKKFICTPGTIKFVFCIQEQITSLKAHYMYICPKHANTLQYINLKWPFHYGRKTIFHNCADLVLLMQNQISTILETFTVLI